MDREAGLYAGRIAASLLYERAFWMRGRMLMLYHFFHPDNVVSAQLFSDLATGLADLDWDVTVLTSNRSHRDRRTNIKERDEAWRGLRIIRCFRPAFNQSSNVGRILNSFCLTMAWVFRILRLPKFDAVIFGTDPQFSYFAMPILKLFRPEMKIAYWAFDLYPEAIIAARMGFLSRAAGLMRPFTKLCYKRVELMVDIGPCMRELLHRYKHKAKCATLVPWAIAEPEKIPLPQAAVRESLFGDCSLAILYSGTMGNAHVFDEFLALARELRRRKATITFCFAGHGNRYEELKSRVTTTDTNVRFAGFAASSELEAHLGSADIHMVSLEHGWQGIVVPSKFFGSLATGRPVIYAGAAGSAIPLWIEQFEVGYHVTASNVPAVADRLCELARDRDALCELQKRAFSCYHAQFSREATTRQWSDSLAQLLEPREKTE